MSGNGLSRKTENQVDTPKQIRVANADVRILVSSRETSGLYTICEVDLAPGQAVPTHAHSYEDVFFHVVSGEYEFDVGGKEARVGKGESVFVPRLTPYSVCSPPGVSGRLLLFAQPGGLDLLFREAATVAVRHGEHLTQAAVAPLMEKHGIVVRPQRLVENK